MDVTWAAAPSSISRDRKDFTGSHLNSRNQSAAHQYIADQIFCAHPLTTTDSFSPAVWPSNFPKRVSSLVHREQHSQATLSRPFSSPKMKRHFDMVSTSSNTGTGTHALRSSKSARRPGSHNPFTQVQHIETNPFRRDPGALTELAKPGTTGADMENSPLGSSRQARPRVASPETNPFRRARLDRSISQRLGEFRLDDPKERQVAVPGWYSKTAASAASHTEEEEEEEEEEEGSERPAFEFAGRGGAPPPPPPPPPPPRNSTFGPSAAGPGPRPFRVHPGVFKHSNCGILRSETTMAISGGSPPRTPLARCGPSLAEQSPVDKPLPETPVEKTTTTTTTTTKAREGGGVVDRQQQQPSPSMIGEPSMVRRSKSTSNAITPSDRPSQKAYAILGSASTHMTSSSPPRQGQGQRQGKGQGQGQGQWQWPLFFRRQGGEGKHAPALGEGPRQLARRYSARLMDKARRARKFRLPTRGGGSGAHAPPPGAQVEGGEEGRRDKAKDGAGAAVGEGEGEGEKECVSCAIRRAEMASRAAASKSEH